MSTWRRGGCCPGKGGDPASTITETIRTDNYTLQLSDAGTCVALNAATGKTFTIPRLATVAWPVGTVIEVYNAGAGLLTLAPGTAVGPIVSPYSRVSLACQGASGTLRFRGVIGGVETWTLEGDLG